MMPDQFIATKDVPIAKNPALYTYTDPHTNDCTYSQNTSITGIDELQKPMRSLYSSITSADVKEGWLRL